MQQRVALARALAIEPRVLLLDEPLSALDAKVRVQLREEIRRIQSRLGITTIYVTHDQEEALSISDRVAVMSQGRIEQIGAPARDLRRARDALRGGVRRHDEPARGDGRGRTASSRLRRRGSRSTRSEGARGRARAGARAARDGRARARERRRLGRITGEVISHTFLGPVMRLKVTSGDNEVTADVPASRANAIPVGMKVQARFPGETPACSASTSLQQQIRPVTEVPSTPRAASSRIRAGSLTV